MVAYLNLSAHLSLSAYIISAYINLYQLISALLAYLGL